MRVNTRVWKIYILFGLSVYSHLARAASQVPDVEMHAMTKEVTSLQKFMFSEGSFLSPANDGSIRSSLEVLNRHLGYLGKGAFAENPALRSNLAIISRQTLESERAFRAGQKSVARMMLLGGLQQCIACHTRTKSVDFVLPEADLPAATPLERADFLFATRQFEKGKDEYEKLVSEFPANHLRAEELRNVFFSLAVYYSRIKSDPNAGYIYFEKVSNKKKLPPQLQKNLKSWASDFSLWAKEMPLPDVTRSQKELWEIAEKFLKPNGGELSAETSGKHDIRRLRASVLLHEILEEPGGQTSIKGDALYSLGLLYQRMGYRLFFRYGELYLETCITEYPKSKTARQCYGALEKPVAGSDVVGAEREVELLKLKRLAF